jgi:hypothetical protein
MPRILRVAGPAAVLLAATGFLAPTTASATGNEGPQCVNALIASSNANNSAISADDESNPSAAATDNTTAAGDLSTAEQTCYYTPSYTAYQDVVQAIVDNGNAKTANSSGSTSTALSDEDSASSLINAASSIEEGYGYL